MWHPPCRRCACRSDRGYRSRAAGGGRVPHRCPVVLRRERKRPCWYRRAYTARERGGLSQVELTGQIGMTLGQVVTGAFCSNRSRAENVEPTHDLSREQHVLLDQQDRDTAFFAKCRHHVADLAYKKRRQPSRRFVEQQKLGLRH